MANSELTQLSSRHPAKPGRLIYSVNLRPSRNRSSVYPFSLGCKVSDDAGRTWSELKIPFKSQVWTNDVIRGCWEPYVQELPDGTLHMYYSDENPYWTKGCRDQNISFLVSTDGGDDVMAVLQSEGWGVDAPIVLVRGHVREVPKTTMLQEQEMRVFVDETVGSRYREIDVSPRLACSRE